MTIFSGFSLNAHRFEIFFLRFIVFANLTLFTCMSDPCVGLFGVELFRYPKKISEKLFWFGKYLSASAKNSIIMVEHNKYLTKELAQLIHDVKVG